MDKEQVRRSLTDSVIAGATAFALSMTAMLFPVADLGFFTGYGTLPFILFISGLTVAMAACFFSTRDFRRGQWRSGLLGLSLAAAALIGPLGVLIVRGS